MLQWCYVVPYAYLPPMTRYADGRVNENCSLNNAVCLEGSLENLESRGMFACISISIGPYILSSCPIVDIPEETPF